MPDSYKYTVSWGLPPFGSFAEGLKFSIQAEHSEELKNGLDRLFGDGTFDRVTGRLVEATFAPNPTPAPVGGTGVTPTATAPTASPPASTTGTANVYGACPECGVGQIVDKFKRGTGEHFGTGCNRYPECQHMASWDRQR